MQDIQAINLQVKNMCVAWPQELHGGMQSTQELIQEVILLEAS